jgi:hypothetical protein
MSATVSLKTTLLAVAAVTVLAAGLGYALGVSNAPDEKTAAEKVLSRVMPPPVLPSYHLASGWSSLPKPPPPAEIVTESTVEEAGGEEAYVPPEGTGTESTSSGSSGSSGGRPHGITITP